MWLIFYLSYEAYWDSLKFKLSLTLCQILPWNQFLVSVVQYVPNSHSLSLFLSHSSHLRSQLCLRLLAAVNVHRHADRLRLPACFTVFTVLFSIFAQLRLWDQTPLTPEILLIGYYCSNVCVRVCVRACMRACVCVCPADCKFKSELPKRWGFPT